MSHHAPPAVHTCPTCQTSSRHTPSHAPCTPCAWGNQRLSMSALSWRHLAYVSISHHPPTLAHTSSWLWPLTSTVDRWLLRWLFDQSKKISVRNVLLSFSHRFQFWALFLYLRYLNPIFWSFSSLWLNKTNEISYVLSPLCWMVLLAIMHGLKIWLSFSRVINCEDMWLI